MKCGWHLSFALSLRVRRALGSHSGTSLSRRSRSSPNGTEGFPMHFHYSISVPADKNVLPRREEGREGFHMVLSFDFLKLLVWIKKVSWLYQSQDTMIFSFD